MAEPSRLRPEDMNMREQLARLAELQELDNRIIEIEMNRDKLPEDLDKQDEVLFAKRSQFEAIENQLGSLETELSEKQRLLDLERLKLKNARNKETAIQNIKQYEAFVREVETQEKSGDELESEIKAINARMKELREEQAHLETQIVKLEGEGLSKRKDLETRISALDVQLDKLYDKRDEMAETVREELYLKYEYIAERKDGIAVAIVQHGHCLACNMSISPQMYNQLIRGDSLLACPACQRILVYVPSDDPEPVEEEKPAAKSKSKRSKKAVKDDDFDD